MRKQSLATIVNKPIRTNSDKLQYLMVLEQQKFLWGSQGLFSFGKFSSEMLSDEVQLGKHTVSGVLKQVSELVMWIKLDVPTELACSVVD